MKSPVQSCDDYNRVQHLVLKTLFYANGAQPAKYAHSQSQPVKGAGVSAHRSHPTSDTLATSTLFCLTLGCTLMCRRPRQKRNAILFFTEAAVQCLNLTFYLIPNLYLLFRPCHELMPIIFWCGWVRWTCWNTVSPPWSVMLCCACLHYSLT